MAVGLLVDRCILCNILLSVLVPQPNVVVCSCFFGYCRHLAARQLCLCCSARPGGFSDVKLELVSGSGDSRNPSWAWCAVECGRRGDRECRRSTSSPLTLHRLRAETLQFRQNPSFSSFSVTLRRIYSCCYTLNKLDASTNGNYAIYRNPRALSNALATLGTLQPRALGFLNRVVPWSRRLTTISNQRR